MNRAEKLVGRVMEHPDFGKVEVLSAITSVKVEIKAIESIGERKTLMVRDNINEVGESAGKGLIWRINRNRQFSHIDECHINQLR